MSLWAGISLHSLFDLASHWKPLNRGKVATKEEGEEMNIPFMHEWVGVGPIAHPGVVGPVLNLA